MADTIPVSQIAGDPQTASVLREFAVSGDHMDLRTLDKNADRYLDYKRAFLEKFSADQFIALQKNLQRFGFQIRDEENTADVFETYRELKQTGLDAGDIYSRLEADAAWFLNDYSWKLPSLLPVFGSAENLIRFLDLLGTMPPWSKRDYWRVRFALSFLGQNQTPLPENQWPAYLQIVSSLLPHVKGHKLKQAAKAIERLPLDWRACTTLAGFGRELAFALNRSVSPSGDKTRWTETWSDVSAMITRIYTREKGRSFITSFGKALSDQALYLLVSLNYGGHVMTAVFDKIWRPRKIGSVNQWMARIDPENEMRAKFLQRISGLDRVRIFNKEVNDVLDALFAEWVKEPSDLYAFATALTHYLEELLPGGTLSNRRKLARLLWRHYQASEAKPMVRRALAFWIGYYAPRYRLGRYQRDLAHFRPERPLPDAVSMPRDEWLRDKQLQARLYFYTDEPYTTVEQDKSDEQKWFEYTQKMLIEDYQWRLEMANLDSKTKSGVLKKEVGGITLRTVLTLQEEGDETGVLSDPNEYELIVHRGHYQPMQRTFPLDGAAIPSAADVPRLLYLGSCKSMSYAATEEFQRIYGREILISDRDVSLGKASTRFIDRLMTDIALGKARWGRYGAYRRFHHLVFPDSPMSQIGRYLSLERRPSR